MRNKVGEVYFIDFVLLQVTAHALHTTITIYLLFVMQRGVPMEPIWSHPIRTRHFPLQTTMYPQVHFIYFFTDLWVRTGALLPSVEVLDDYTVKLLHNTTIGTNKMWSLYTGGLIYVQ